MHRRALQHSIFFVLCVSLSSGSSIMRPFLKIVKHDKLEEQEKRILFSSSTFSTELAGQSSIPIVNPSPDSPTSFDNPSSPPSPILTQPTTPTPTLPQMPPLTPTTPTTLPPIPPSSPMTPQNPTPSATPQSPTTVPITPNNPITTPNTPMNPTTTPTSSGGGSWCIAKSDASPNALQVGLDYACGYGGAECSAIQPGASCYNPNTVKDHASYAFNSYYHKHPGPNSCDFGGIAQLTNTDPSTGNCHYMSSTSSSTTPPTNTGMTPPANTGFTPPASLSPPGGSTFKPPTSTFPGGSTDYGAEPTGLPNSANSKLCCILLMVIGSLFGLIIPTYHI